MSERPPVDGSAARSDYAATLNNAALPDDKLAGLARGNSIAAGLQHDSDGVAAAPLSDSSGTTSGHGRASGGNPQYGRNDSGIGPIDRRPSDQRTYQDLTGTFPIPYLVRPQRGPPRQPGNPTAPALFIFAITLGTLGVYLVNGSLSVYNNAVGLTLFGGGLTLWVMALLELLQGNTYGATVLMGFAVFYAAFSATLIPWFGAVAAYTESASTSGLSAAELKRQSKVALGVWYAAYSIFDMIVWPPTFRISVIFNFIIGILIPCFWSLAISQFVQDPVASARWGKAGGAFAIASAAAGFYAGAAALWNKDSVGFNVPVGEYVRPQQPITDQDEEYNVGRKQQ